MEVASAISRRKRSCCFESETQKRGTERVGLAGPVLPPCTADPSAVPALRPRSRPDSRCWAARGRRGAAGTAQHSTALSIWGGWEGSVSVGHPGWAAS